MLHFQTAIIDSNPAAIPRMETFSFAFQIAHHQLQEREVAPKSNGGGADDCEHAGLGSDDRQRQSPCGYVLAAEKISVKGVLLLAEADAKKGDGSQINDDNKTVEPVES